jgi:hypothetical protein
VVVNGETTTFKLDGKGRGKSGNSSLKVSGTASRLTLKNQSFGTNWAAQGKIDHGAASGSVDINLSMDANESAFAGSVTTKLIGEPNKGSKLRK